ncbi:response regulator [Flavobacterium phycosphaerae]|uniref:response regulator n=1 Tax=Flavobacterium phycosphaerae TaxID=2697515 RepID=UPI001389B35D|nr:response regulator [Flavobacterium phycosphaerae]
MKNKVICIIDDDPIYQLLINKIIAMSETEYDVISFKNGKEAIESFKADLEDNKEMPEIILLDIEMPIMDGWDFMNQIEKSLSGKTKKTAIYIVSSSIAYEDKEKAKTFPEIMGYFSKPIDSSKIMEITKHVTKSK